MISKEPYKFTLHETEQAKFDKWFKRHHTKMGSCKIAVRARGEFSAHGAIDGHLQWIFTPNSIGQAISVKCSCGEEVNLTNYDIW